MSSILKEKIPDGVEPDFSINEFDVIETLKTFARGINEEEKRRFEGIYAKFQDKGGVTADSIKQQKQI